MTRAPRSASWRVANGAATACSAETTVIPASGSPPAPPSEAGTGSAEHEGVAGAPGHLDPHRLVPQVLVQPLAAVLAAEAGRLDPAERHREVQRPVSVDPPGAHPQLLGHAERALDIPRPQAGPPARSGSRWPAPPPLPHL